MGSDRGMVRFVLWMVGYGGLLLAALAGLGFGLSVALGAFESFREPLPELAWLPAAVWGVLGGAAVFVALGFAPAMVCLAMLIEEHLLRLRAKVDKHLREIDLNISALLTTTQSSVRR